MCPKKKGKSKTERCKIGGGGGQKGKGKEPRDLTREMGCEVKNRGDQIRELGWKESCGSPMFQTSNERKGERHVEPPWKGTVINLAGGKITVKGPLNSEKWKMKGHGGTQTKKIEI